MKNAESNGATDISDVDFEQESINPLGSDIEDLALTECKWYQIACHLGNFWRWLNSKPGQGGQTNLQMMTVLLAAVIAAISL